jgi:threonine/homoserine/homoserine lactone efflux protein
MSLEFLITALIVVLVPGTGVIYTLSCGLTRGARVSIAAAFGCTLGIVPHMAASIFGLAALLHASALAFQLVKYAGVAYLLYMAWNAWRESGTLDVSEKVEASGLRKVATRGILINILNPKLSIFFLAFLPQFVAADAASPVLQMSGLALVFMALTFIVFVIYGTFAAAVRSHVISRPTVMTWMRRVFAMTFAGLGAKLAFAER